MQEFIEMVTNRLGIAQSQAESATGGLLSGLQQHLAPQDFQDLQQQLPGSEEVMRQAPAPEPGGGGLLSQLGGLGSSVGSVGGLIAPLTRSGLSQDKASGFIQMFVDYLRSKVDGQLMERIVSQVPGLSALAGQQAQ